MVVLLASAVLLVSAGSSAAMTVRMSDIHATLELPAGWTYERNVTSGGELYDLEMQTVVGGKIVYGLLTHTPWPKLVTNNTLWAWMQVEMNEIVEDPEITDFVVASPAVNRTINGVMACQGDVKVWMGGEVIRERLVVLASDGWDMGWGLGLATLDQYWTEFSFQITSIMESFTVDEAPEGLEMSGMLIVAGVAVAAAVVAVVIALLVMRGRRGPAEIPVPPPPPAQEPPQPPPPPPPAQQ